MPAPATSRLAPLLALLLLVGACQSDSDPAEDDSAGLEVRLVDFAIEAPAETDSTTIDVVNDGEVDHTFTAVDESFDTGPIEPGEAVQLEIEGQSTYQVICTIHPAQMSTSIDVGGPS